MRADAARNREQILESARELVAARGTAITMDELASRSGVAVGTLYRHFPTKDDLVAAIIEESVERLAALAEGSLTRVQEGASPWAELTRFWAAIAEGPRAGRATRLAAASLGIRLRESQVPDAATAGPAARALIALTALLEASQRSGEMRRDVNLADLFLLLAQAPEHDEPSLRARYFQLVSDGLRPG
jgi:AcrR family transcriptional regulator